MNKYKVVWWEEQVMRRVTVIEAKDEEEAADNAMYFGKGEIVSSEFVEATDEGRISTTLIKGKENG